MGAGGVTSTVRCTKGASGSELLFVELELVSCKFTGAVWLPESVLFVDSVEF